MNEKILKMYFEDKMKQIEIAKELNISKYKVSRVVTKDFRYKLEKEKRKEINKKKHNAQTMQYIAKKRKQRKFNCRHKALRQKENRSGGCKYKAF